MTLARAVGGAGQPVPDPTGLPADRVVRVDGAGADHLAAMLAQGPPALPAPLVHRLRPATTPAELVDRVLDDLESAAVGLFPAWLPGAEPIRPGGAGLVAIRALATAHARRSGHSGPFLSDLAAAALGGGSVRRRRLPPQTRIAGLVRVIAHGLGRGRLVLVLEVPAGLDAASGQVVAAGCGWLADHGGCGVWLTGGPLATVDWLTTVDWPGSSSWPVTADRPVVAAPGTAPPAVPPAAPPTVPPPTPPVVPPAPPPAVLGAPHHRSNAEAVLEAALAAQPWAAGRRWNQTYQSHPLRTPVRLDLLFPRERCVVEIDGPEHCQPAAFDADRRRDVQLQLDGYRVLRFTNARVLHDVGAVVAQIGQLIQTRRQQPGREQHDR